MLQLTLRRITEHGGSLRDIDIENLAHEAPERLVKLECNACRLLCRAKEVRHLADIINHSGRDAVRDVRLLNSDPAWKLNFSRQEATQ